MEYYIKCKNKQVFKDEDFEQQIECMLNVGDVCNTESDILDESSFEFRLLISYREYYPICEQWIFWGDIITEGEL